MLNQVMEIRNFSGHTQEVYSLLHLCSQRVVCIQFFFSFFEKKTLIIGEQVILSS